MAHEAQQKFCSDVKSRFPEHFKHKKVLDVGSLDINGNNRYLFDQCHYIGIDLGEGENVDIICPCHKLEVTDGFYDTIISTECFEHDKYLKMSLRNIVRILKSGGLFLFTCATKGRREHGTRGTNRKDSPFTLDFYRNVTEEMVRGMIDIDDIFENYEFNVITKPCDLRFWGIKK